MSDVAVDLRAPAAPPLHAPLTASALARLAFALTCLSLGLHLALAGEVALSPQETYYWQYARHLDLSYFDHPPLAAWTIRLTTALFGNGAHGVRLAATLHAALFSLFLFSAGRRLFDARVALGALLAASLAPLFAIGQTVITPDAPLLAGWAAALYFTVRALQEERGGWLLAAGFATGFASLGKYTGWLLAPQILLTLLYDPRGRRLLRGPWAYLGLALAVALFSPVLLWNARHGWVSFGFQFGARQAAASAFDAARVARFLGLQALLLTPVLALGTWAAAALAACRFRDPAFRLCALFALPPLALFLAVSPFLWVKGNWPTPAYPSALLAAAALCRAKGGARSPIRRGIAIAALITAATGSLYLHLAMLFPSFPFPARDDVTSGWKALAARVDRERARLPAPSFVLGCGYKPASELAYYLPDRPETAGQNVMGEPGLQYGFWIQPSALVGREGILVRDAREGGACRAMARACQPLIPLEPLQVNRGAQAVTTFQLWRCRFTGLDGPVSEEP